MNSKSKKILLYGSAIIVALFAVYGIYRLSVRQFIAKTPFRRRTIRVAKEELDIWGGGKRKESESKMYPEIKKYWDKGILEFIYDPENEGIYLKTNAMAAINYLTKGE